METEIWKESKEHKNYEISNLGNVRHIINKKNIKLVLNNSGYYKWRARGVFEFVHRSVYKAFVTDIPNGMVINHIDFNKLNNLVSNLELTTQKQNINHSIKSGRYLEANRIQSQKLKLDNPFCKLTEEQIQKRTKNRKLNYKPENHGMYGKKGFDNPKFKYTVDEIKNVREKYNKNQSMNSISKELNITYSRVYKLCKGKYKDIIC
jgi:hypothetical protein